MTEKGKANSVNYGTFKTVKNLIVELNRMLSDSGRDIPLNPPIRASMTQQGSRFVSVTLEPEQK